MLILFIWLFNQDAEMEKKIRDQDRNTRYDTINDN